MSAKALLVAVLGLHLCVQCCVAGIDYGQALTKSILYFEAQRSGKLPPDQRAVWRGDSGLNDGKDAGVDLSGGYFDAGDNVKFGFPMAFAVTMLGWSVVEYADKLAAKGELRNARNAIKWGTNYMIAAHTKPTELYVEVGDGNSDHACWQRPEDMTTPRTAYKINEANHGSDVAGETAAALAAASIAFADDDKGYSTTLLIHAKQLFDFARNNRGLYTSSVPIAGGFYASTGDDDELAWAAAWLYRATGDKAYLDFLSSGGDGGVRSMFSWDDKWLGVQTLVSWFITTGKVPGDSPWAEFRENADMFLCNAIQKGTNNVKMSPGGMLWWTEWNNFQYTTSSMLALAVHADHYAKAGGSMGCQPGTVYPPEMTGFVFNQMNYILGANPKNMSYLVGFGSNYPLKVHHRAGSIVSFKANPTPVTCNGGFSDWYNKDAPNPNVVDGAIVGGPDANDHYDDSRTNFQQAEPAVANTAPFVGVLARFA